MDYIRRLDAFAGPPDALEPILSEIQFLDATPEAFPDMARARLLAAVCAHLGRVTVAGSTHPVHAAGGRALARLLSGGSAVWAPPPSCADPFFTWVYPHATAGQFCELLDTMVERMDDAASLQGNTALRSLASHVAHNTPTLALLPHRDYALLCKVVARVGGGTNILPAMEARTLASPPPKEARVEYLIALRLIRTKACARLVRHLAAAAMADDDAPSLHAVARVASEALLSLLGPHDAGHSLLLDVLCDMAVHPTAHPLGCEVLTRYVATRATTPAVITLHGKRHNLYRRLYAALPTLAHPEALVPVLRPVTTATYRRTATSAWVPHMLLSGHVDVVDLVTAHVGTFPELFEPLLTVPNISALCDWDNNTPLAIARMRLLAAVLVYEPQFAHLALTSVSHALTITTITNSIAEAFLPLLAKHAQCVDDVVRHDAGRAVVPLAVRGGASLEIGLMVLRALGVPPSDTSSLDLYMSAVSGSGSLLAAECLSLVALPPTYATLVARAAVLVHSPSSAVSQQLLRGLARGVATFSDDAIDLVGPLASVHPRTPYISTVLGTILFTTPGAAQRYLSHATDDAIPNLFQTTPYTSGSLLMLAALGYHHRDRVDAYLSSHEHSAYHLVSYHDDDETVMTFKGLALACVTVPVAVRKATVYSILRAAECARLLTELQRALCAAAALRVRALHTHETTSSLGPVDRETTPAACLRSADGEWVFLPHESRALSLGEWRPCVKALHNAFLCGDTSAATRSLRILYEFTLTEAVMGPSDVEAVIGYCVTHGQSSSHLCIHACLLLGPAAEPIAALAMMWHADTHVVILNSVGYVDYILTYIMSASWGSPTVFRAACDVMSSITPATLLDRVASAFLDVMASHLPSCVAAVINAARPHITSLSSHSLVEICGVVCQALHHAEDVNDVSAARLFTSIFLTRPDTRPALLELGKIYPLPKDDPVLAMCLGRRHDVVNLDLTNTLHLEAIITLQAFEVCTNAEEIVAALLGAQEPTAYALALTLAIHNGLCKQASVDVTMRAWAPYGEISLRGELISEESFREHLMRAAPTHPRDVLSLLRRASHLDFLPMLVDMILTAPDDILDDVEDACRVCVTTCGHEAMHRFRTGGGWDGLLRRKNNNLRLVSAVVGTFAPLRELQVLLLDGVTSRKNDVLELLAAIVTQCEHDIATTCVLGVITSVLTDLTPDNNPNLQTILTHLATRVPGALLFDVVHHIGQFVSRMPVTPHMADTCLGLSKACPDVQLTFFATGTYARLGASGEPYFSCCCELVVAAAFDCVIPAFYAIVPTLLVAVHASSPPLPMHTAAVRTLCRIDGAPCDLESCLQTMIAQDETSTVAAILRLCPTTAVGDTIPNLAPPAMSVPPPQDYSTAIQGMSNQHQAQLAAANASALRALEETKQTHSREMANMKREHDAHLVAIREECLAANRVDLVRLERTLESQHVDMHGVLAEQALAKDTHHEAAMLQARLQNASLERLLTETTARRNETREAMSLSERAEMVRLVSDNAAKDLAVTTLRSSLADSVRNAISLSRELFDSSALHDSALRKVKEDCTLAMQHHTESLASRSRDLEKQLGDADTRHLVLRDTMRATLLAQFEAHRVRSAFHSDELIARLRLENQSFSVFAEMMRPAPRVPKVVVFDGQSEAIFREALAQDAETGAWQMYVNHTKSARDMWLRNALSDCERHRLETVEHARVKESKLQSQIAALAGECRAQVAEARVAVACERNKCEQRITRVQFDHETVLMEERARHEEEIEILRSELGKALVLVESADAVHAGVVQSAEERLALQQALFQTHQNELARAYRASVIAKTLAAQEENVALKHVAARVETTEVSAQQLRDTVDAQLVQLAAQYHLASTCEEDLFAAQRALCEEQVLETHNMIGCAYEDGFHLALQTLSFFRAGEMARASELSPGVVSELEAAARDRWGLIVFQRNATIDAMALDAAGLASRLRAAEAKVGDVTSQAEQREGSLVHRITTLEAHTAAVTTLLDRAQEGLRGVQESSAARKAAVLMLETATVEFEAEKKALGAELQGQQETIMRLRQGVLDADATTFRGKASLAAAALATAEHDRAVLRRTVSQLQAALAEASSEAAGAVVRLRSSERQLAEVRGSAEERIVALEARVHTVASANAQLLETIETHQHDARTMRERCAVAESTLVARDESIVALVAQTQRVFSVPEANPANPQAMELHQDVETSRLRQQLQTMRRECEHQRMSATNALAHTVHLAARHHASVDRCTSLLSVEESAPIVRAEIHRRGFDLQQVEKRLDGWSDTLQSRETELNKKDVALNRLAATLSVRHNVPLNSWKTLPSEKLPAIGSVPTPKNIPTPTTSSVFKQKEDVDKR